MVLFITQLHPTQRRTPRLSESSRHSSEQSVNNIPPSSREQTLRWSPRAVEIMQYTASCAALLSSPLSLHTILLVLHLKDNLGLIFWLVMEKKSTSQVWCVSEEDV